MMDKRAVRAVVATFAVVALFAAGCGSSSKKSAATPNSSASTGKPITIGMVVDLTGTGAPTYAVAVKGAEARIGLQNAEGGVNGHPLKLVTVDTQSTPTGAATAAAGVVTTDHALVVETASEVAFGAARYLNQAGIPVFGDGLDGPEWGDQPNTNMFSPLGNINPTTDNDDDTVVAQFVKNVGGTNAAVLAYGPSPSSQDAGKEFAKAAESLGMKVGYENLSLPFGSVDATPIALGMKQAGVDSMYPAIQEPPTFAILTAARQSGVNMKAALGGTGYGQELLDQPAVVQAGQNAYYMTFQVPVEERTPATITEQNALAKYGGFSGVPSIDVTFGWLDADLAIRGLEAAGPKYPTGSAVISNLRKVTDWDGGGLLPTTRDFSLAHFGMSPPTACFYFVTLHGAHFVPVPADGKPTCGHKLG
jgi:branched-chain amino acid transport system substrate-binding protein